ALLQVGHDLAGILDYRNAADRVTSIVFELFQVRRTAFYRFDPESRRLICLAAAGPSNGTRWAGRVLESGEGVIAIASTDGRPAWSPDILEDDRVTLPTWLRNAAQADGLRAVAAVPLTAHGQLIGALSLLDAAGRFFSEDDLRLLSAIADQVAL